MLRSLTVRDFVIVEHLELEFSAGFSVLTGETGAGKSILIDALALTLGERADPGVVRAGCERAEIAALFSIAEQPSVLAWLAEHDFAGDCDVLLRRVVDVSGRSRAYINGSPATVQQLRQLGDFLVDIHGQHAHQSLLRSEAQRQLFDAHAGLEAIVQGVAAAWRQWRQAVVALEQASSDAEGLRREREQLEWQVGELERLALGSDEWAFLEQEQRRLGHASGLIDGARYALAVLNDDDSAACIRQVDLVANRIDDLLEVDPQLRDVSALLQSVQAELGEAVSLLQRYVDRVDADPMRLQEVEQRIDEILLQARRYRVAPTVLPELLGQWQQRLAELDEAADLLALQRRQADAEAVYQQQAKELSRLRQAAAVSMGRSVSEVMRQLALSSGCFEVALLPLAQGGATGCEQIEFRIGGLAGNEPRSLAKVASGGELSRISLAIQVLTARSVSVPTLIFDEVDVGIGGGVAEIVGRLLRQLGSERQVLCVTHLPQVAAQANQQWRVSKARHADGGMRSAIEPLSVHERVTEIARMLGGVELTEITLAHARELLAAGGN